MESAACFRDVTHQYSSKDFGMSEELYNLLWFFLRHKTAQIEHKQKAPFWGDLDEVGWRVTSLSRIQCFISKEGKNT